MDPQEPVATDIAEETSAAPKKRKRSWLAAGLGGALLLVALAALILVIRPAKHASPVPTPEEIGQLKYDADQQQTEDRKAAQLRNDPFLVRKEDENQRQLNELLRDLGIDKNPAGEFPVPLQDRQARAEEEAIAGVLREPGPARPYSATTRRTTRAADQPSPPVSSTDTAPMFVYSRTYGAAKYVDAPQKKAEARPQSTEQPVVSSATTAKPVASEAQNQPPDRAAERKTVLIYTDLPPVTLNEGEMLEAVLVNRIIADTEPSPVVCHLAKDVFDQGARYVVFPASSRIVGLSQVVNYKGAHRLFISFHRIILPNGPSVDLPPGRRALKALDETGALGIVSKVERHWFLQFGTAIFFGVLDGLAGAAQRNRDVFSTTSVILGRTSESFDRILENIMSQYSTIVPTIRVDQGKKMKIYLSEDILISSYAKISDRSYYAQR